MIATSSGELKNMNQTSCPFEQNVDDFFAEKVNIQFLVECAPLTKFLLLPVLSYNNIIRGQNILCTISSLALVPALGLS